MKARGILICLCVAAIALVGARAGLGGIEGTDGPVAVGTAKPLFTGARLAPGQTVVGTARISNAGEGAGRFVLSASVSGRLAAELDVTVSDTAGRIVYRGSLVDLASAPIGVLRPGESRTLRVAVEIPDDTPVRTAGLTAGASFTWTATAAV